MLRINCQRLIAPVVCLSILLSGCRANPPSASQAVSGAATATLAPTITGTAPLTASASTATVAPTPVAPTPEPSATPTDTAEPPTLAPAPTATETDAPPSPTAPPPPTAVPTANPPSASSLAAARKAMEDGDYAQAIDLWEGALAATDDATQRPAILLALARAQAAQQRYSEAIALLAQVVEAHPSEAELAQAYALLANCYEGIGERQAAINAFASYLGLDTSAMPYVRWHMAQNYEALGDDERMEQQLVAIDLSTLSTSMQAEILEELAATRRRRQNYAGALETYQRILSFSANASYRALILRYEGETLQEAGRAQEAIDTFRRVLQEYPTTSSATMALDALDALQAAQIDDLQRGQILYYGGRYQPALQALERYIGSTPQGDMPRAHYFAGLAYTKLGQYGEAFRYFDVLIDQFPQDPLTGEAWMAKAQAAQANGGDPTGLYQEFARLYPGHGRAPEALWKAAQGMEGQRNWAQAASLYRQLRASYPADSGAPESHFREGLCAYIAGDAASAYAVWTEALQGASSAEKPRLLTWLGLAARATGNESQAQSHWQQAAVAAPWTYYGLRARDLATGKPVVLPPSSPAAPQERALTPADWDEIARWMATWTRDATAALDEARLARAQALRTLGWHAEAVTVYREVWNQARATPGGAFHLAQTMYEAGERWLVISCADRLLSLGEQAGAAEPPRALVELAYPTQFADLVNAECASGDLDPLLFLALVRQESRFDPRAVSYAGATGLTQVMPATGRDIATKLSVAPFRTDLLTWPVVSVRFGVFYFGWLVDYANRDWIAALVGYNAGPGNLRKWTDGQPIADHDLFYETVLYGQAKDYVTYIYGQYRRYEDIYR